VDVLRHLGFGPLLFLLPVSWHLFFFFVSVLDALPQENADLRLQIVSPDIPGSLARNFVGLTLLCAVDSLHDFASLV